MRQEVVEECFGILFQDGVLDSIVIPQRLFLQPVMLMVLDLMTDGSLISVISIMMGLVMTLDTLTMVVIIDVKDDGGQDMR